MRSSVSLHKENQQVLLCVLCHIYICIEASVACGVVEMLRIFVVEQMDMILHGIMQSTLEHCVEKL